MNLRLPSLLAGLVLVAACQSADHDHGATDRSGAGQADGAKPAPPASPEEVARAKALMKPFEGNWDSEMYFMGMGPMKGTEEVTLVSGGLVALVKAGGSAGPSGNFEGHGMFGFEPKTKVWSHVWSDNMDPGLFVSQGSWSADGKTLTVEQEMDMGMGAGPQTMLMVNTLTGEGTREFKMLAKDAKPEAAPMVTAKYKRKAN